MTRLVALAVMVVAATGCNAPAPTAEDLIPEYLGIEAEVLDKDLVQVRVKMTNALAVENLTDYADCAVAGFAQKKEHGFARHLRTNIEKEGGIWHADAIYTISPSLPEGLKTIDAEVAAQECKARGIPTV